LSVIAKMTKIVLHPTIPSSNLNKRNSLPPPLPFTAPTNPRLQCHHRSNRHPQRQRIKIIRTTHRRRLRKSNSSKTIPLNFPTSKTFTRNHRTRLLRLPFPYLHSSGKLPCNICPQRSQMSPSRSSTNSLQGSRRERENFREGRGWRRGGFGVEFSEGVSTGL
jgi:hypothetical protein